MNRFLPCLFILLIAGCSAKESIESRRLEPPPVHEPVKIEGIPPDGSVQRETAIPLNDVRLITIPKDETDTEAQQLLGDGTLYRVEVDRLGKEGASLVRIDNVTNGNTVETRIPLVAPPGQQLRTEDGLGLRVSITSVAVRMDRNRHGWVWWEEDGPSARLIEFRIDGDQATMVPPGGGLDDPNKPIARRFNRTPPREIPYRFTSGAIRGIGRDAPRAFLGGSGFDLGISRIGTAATEAVVESPAYDLPSVDVAESAPGQVTVTIGYISGDETGHVRQVTYDSNAKAWKDHRPLADFPKAQIVEVGDVGAAGALANLIVSWSRSNPEPGLYWLRPDRSVRHVLGHTREMKTVTVPDGFVALLQDEFMDDVKPEDQHDIWVVRARGDRLALYRFENPGRCPSAEFAWLGGNRFGATFCGQQVVVFTLPE